MSHLLSSRYVITSDNSFKPLPPTLSYFLYTYMFTDTVPTPLTYVEPKFPLWSDYSHYFIMTVPVHIYVYTRLLQNVTFTTPPRLKQNNSQQKPHLVGTYISHPSFAYYAPTRSFPFFPRNRSCAYTAPLAPTYLVDDGPIKSRSFFVPTFSRPPSLPERSTANHNSLSDKGHPAPVKLYVAICTYT